MSRVIAGVAGGQRLASVPGDNTRPTTDRVKEALFSRLDAYEVLDGARVLDLFGGSGALGCEALSRGAAYVDFVDHYPKAIAVIEKNAGLMKKSVSGTSKVHKMTAASFVEHYSGAPYDVVFIDPPYALENDVLFSLLEKLVAHVVEGSVIVLERSTRSPEPDLPEGLESFATKQYGETTLWYVEPIGSTDEQ